MLLRYDRMFILALLMGIGLLAGGCSSRPVGTATPGTPSPQAPHTSTAVPGETLLAPTIELATYPGPASPGQYPGLAASPTSLAATPLPSSIPPTASPTVGQGNPAYPGPGGSPTAPGGPSPYPAPGTQVPTSPPSPTTRVTSPASPAPGASLTPASTSALTPGPTPEATLSVTPTERPVTTSQPPPAPAKTVILWHSWDPMEAQTLNDVIKAFQNLHPDIQFDVLFVPQDELQGKYESAAYLGNGPSLILGPASWGPSFYNKSLVADLSKIADPEFLKTINPAALAEARYKGALIGLPHRINNGVLLFRNTAIIPERPATFNDLVSLAKRGTHGGTVGAYLDRSYYYGAGSLYGLGGSLMDANGNPSFNNDTGVAWIILLNSFSQAGPVDFNSSRDTNLFKTGKAGMIIDDSQNMKSLANAIGAGKLAIDPWPAFGNGHLSGFIQTDNIYLSTNVAGDDQYAALLFMGFFLDRQVQVALTRAGHIPAVMGVRVDDPLMQQALEAFKGASPYPVQPEAKYYWDPLELAMQSIYDGSVTDIRAALREAYNTITAEIAAARAGK